MNREQIETTPAGPELDRLVAEAKGIAIQDGRPCKHPGCLSHVSHPCEGCGRLHPSLIPPWSTDIAAAWDLVEEMDIKNRIDLNHGVALDGEWRCTIQRRDDNYSDYIMTQGITAPEAIARTYLLAKLEAEP